MQTIKSFTFIMLLCSSLNVFSLDVNEKQCKANDKTSIKNSMFTLLNSTPGKGRCGCVFGYKESGTHDWNPKDGRKNEGFTGACILDSNVNPNTDDWATGTAIGAIVGAGVVGAGVVGAGIAAIVRYKCSSCQSVGPSYEDGLSSARNNMSIEDPDYAEAEFNDYLSPTPSDDGYLSPTPSDDGYLSPTPNASGASGGPTEELEYDDAQYNANEYNSDNDVYDDAQEYNSDSDTYYDALSSTKGNNSATPFSGEGGEGETMELTPLSNPSDSNYHNMPNNQPPNESETTC